MPSRRASENRFPLIRLATIDDTPATPPAGELHLVGGADKILRYIDEDDNLYELGLAGSGVPDGTDPGDLLVWDGAGWAVLGVGADGKILAADSGESLGLAWVDDIGGGGGTDLEALLAQGEFAYRPVSNVEVLNRTGSGSLGGGFTSDSGHSFAATAGKTYRVALAGWGGGTLNMGMEWDPGDVTDAWYTGPTVDFVCPAGKTTGTMFGRNNGGNLSWTSYTVTELNSDTSVDGFLSSTVGRQLLAAARGAAIADATDATTVIARLNDLLAFLRARGDIST